MRPSARSPLLAAAACFLGFGVAARLRLRDRPVGRLDAIALHGLTALDEGPLYRLPASRLPPTSPIRCRCWSCSLRCSPGDGRLGAGARRSPRSALVAGANLTGPGLKVALAHPRFHPLLGRDQLGAEAFPSGHATAAMSIALAAVLVAPARVRVVVASVAAAYVIAVATSLLVIGWHYPSDVAGRVAGLLRLLLLGGRRRSRGCRWARGRRGPESGAGALAGARWGRGCRAGRGEPDRTVSRRGAACLRARAYGGHRDGARPHGDLGRPGRERHADRRPLLSGPVAGLAVCGGSAVRGLDVRLPDAVYLQRHGADGYVLPHRIDHLANMRSLAAGGLRPGAGARLGGRIAPRSRPGDVRVPRRLHRLGCRPGGVRGRARPPRARIRPRTGGAASSLAWRDRVGSEIVDGGAYWQTRGPRLETPAEIRLMAATRATGRDDDRLGVHCRLRARPRLRGDLRGG